MLLVFVVLPSDVVAASSGSTIRTEVCDASSPPVISITSPQTDSIVNQPTITIAGSVVRTSQIDIFINNQYASSVAIGSTNNFSTQTGMTRGTNTIRLDASYSCNNTTASETVVVTYEPSSAPSSGANTSTVTITPSDPGPGIISNPMKNQNFVDSLFDRDGINAQR